MDRPPPDPVKLLDIWMRWERGDETPGRVMADLKTGGMREVLEHLADPGVATGATGTG
jgi:predicted methyltransferase